MLTQLYSTASFSLSGKWGRDGVELSGCGIAVSSKGAGAAAPSVIGTTA